MRHKFLTLSSNSSSTARENYINDLFAKSTDSLVQVSELITKLNLPKIQISATEGKLLQLFIKLQKIESIVEIGTNVGYSTLWLAAELPSSGILHTIEKDPNLAKMAEENFSLYKTKIRLHVGEAMTVLAQLSAGGPYDMVFIDANKSQYLDYLAWAENNLRSGGLLVADNILLSGTVFLPRPEWPPHIKPKLVSRMQEFNRKLADTTKFYTAFIPSIDGMTISIKL